MPSVDPTFGATAGPLAVPAVETEIAQTLLASDTATTAAYASAGIIDVRLARSLTLYVEADAGGAADQLAMLIAVSNSETQPVANADEWGIPVVTDGAVTIGAGAGAIASGQDWTLLPAKWGQVLLNPGEYRFPAFGGATEEGRWVPSFDVHKYRWAQVLIADFGGGTRQAVGIKYARAR